MASSSSSSSSSSSDNKNKVHKLRSSDGKVFELEESVALQSDTIEKSIEECINSSIPILNVTSEVLAKVIEFCKNHVDGAMDYDEEALKQFDAEFVKVNEKMLYELIMAADYMNIKSLLDLTCQAVADMIKGRTVEEIQRIFKIENDATPEEEAALCDEHDWLFENIHGESKYAHLFKQ